MVPRSDAIINPDAMVIHSENTGLALIAMVHSWRLPPMALITLFVIILISWFSVLDRASPGQDGSIVAEE